MAAEGWRVALITTVTPVAEYLIEAVQALGHEPVAVIGARRAEPLREVTYPELSDATAPRGVDIVLARDKWSMEPLLRACRPDLTLCWGFPWRIPMPALEVPPLGSINLHPAVLPRHRGPIPISWAIRDGDQDYGVTWHRMDAELDTGGILAQATVPMDDEDFDYFAVGPRLVAAAVALLPRVLELVASGDPGDPQDDDAATWAGHFEADYVQIDWSRPARAIHTQVRAWAFVTPNPVMGPTTDLDGRQVRVTRTSLVDPGGHARRMEAGDGPLWIVASEPV